MANLNSGITSLFDPDVVKALPIGLIPPKPGKTKVKPRKRAKVAPKRAKAAKTPVKQGKTVVDCFVYPNKGKNEIDSVEICLNGKKQAFPALSKVKLDIMSLDSSNLVKQFFADLNSPKLSGIQFVYKNAYNFLFGLGEVRPSSYKCVIANHFSDGLSTLVFNQGKHANIDRIKAALDKASLSYVPKATYCYVNLSKDNLPKVVKVAKGLLGLSKG